MSMPDYVSRLLSGFYIWGNDILYKLPDIFSLNFTILKGISVVFMMIFLIIIVGHLLLNFKSGAFSLIKRAGFGILFLLAAGFFFTKVAFDETNRVYVDMDLIDTKVTNSEANKRKMVNEFGFTLNKSGENRQVTLPLSELNTFEIFIKPTIVSFKSVNSGKEKCDEKGDDIFLDSAIQVQVCSIGGKDYVVLDDQTVLSYAFTDIVSKISELKSFYRDGTKAGQKENEIIDYFKINYIGKLSLEDKNSLINLTNGNDPIIDDSIKNFIEELSKITGSGDLVKKKANLLKILNNKLIDVSSILYKKYGTDPNGNGIITLGDTQFIFYTEVYKEAYAFGDKQTPPKHISFGANNAEINGLVVFSDRVYKLSLSHPNSYAKFAMPNVVKSQGLSYYSPIPYVLGLLFYLLYVINVILFLGGNLFILLIAFNLFPLKNEVGNF